MWEEKCLRRFLWKGPTLIIGISIAIGIDLKMKANDLVFDSDFDPDRDTDSTHIYLTLFCLNEVKAYVHLRVTAAGTVFFLSPLHQGP